MTGRDKLPGVFAKKSFSEGCVALGIKLRCSGWISDSARIDASTDLTIEQARALAKSLTDFANQAEAKVKAQEEAAERRKKYRDREVAAGRMKIFGAAEFFRK